MNRMSKTEIPAASGTNITSNASAISTAASSSTAQRTFLSKYRLHKKFVAAARVLLLVVFLSVWELTASHQIIDSFIFSSPSKIARCFLDMVADRSIFLHLGVTLYETIVSFLLVIVFSILTAVLLWFSKKLSEILEPYLVVLNSLPKSALAPLLIVWLGATRTTIIVAGMSVAIFGSNPSQYTLNHTSFTMYPDPASTDDPDSYPLRTGPIRYCLNFDALLQPFDSRRFLPATLPTRQDRIETVRVINGDHVLLRKNRPGLLIYLFHQVLQT